MDSASAYRDMPERRVVVRFKDDEVLVGLMRDIDLDQPDFTLRLPDADTGSRAAIIPVSSVKNIMLQRVELDTDLDRSHMSAVAIHFWDGEVVNGLLGSEPERRRYGMTVPLVSPALDEIEVLGIPYASVKAIHIATTSAWAARRPIREAERWTLPRIDAPLLDLLGEIRKLRTLRTEGGITDEDFARRRREVLQRI